jgi:hypothetical protein
MREEAVEIDDIFRNSESRISRDMRIVFSENRATYEALNRKRKKTCRIRIDGTLIKETVMKCDYGLWVEDNRMILIELKGSDVSHAVEQLENTHRILSRVKGCEKLDYLYRVVSSKVSTPNLSSRLKALKRKGIDVVIKSTRLVEEI